MAAALRVTRRCLLADLGYDESDLELGAEELAKRYEIVRAFVQRRSQSPIGQETIQGLTSKIVAYSLHSGEFRGITWHDRNSDIVWLLATGFHRSGKADDAYPYFLGLDAASELLPTREDISAYFRSAAVSLAKALRDDAPPLRQLAIDAPRTVQSGTIGGRVAVRFVYEDSDPPLFTVAVSQRLQPGNMEVPPRWQIIVAAAFLPLGTPAESLSFAWDLAGEPLNEDEVAYCDFVEG